MRFGLLHPVALLLATCLAAFALPPGYADRSPSLDVLPGFHTPPPGYGEVSFYWWLGDPLTRERLTWELDQLKGKGISSLQVNYAHSDKGGRSWGLTYPSEPRLFSEPWWKLFGWFLKEARARGMSASLSDYTLGWPGQGWYFDEILKEEPDAHGALLASTTHDCSGGSPCIWEMPAAPISVVAYPKSGVPVDLRASVAGARLNWNAPPGQWRIVAVHAVEKPESLDPMNPASGRLAIAKFFQRFEDRNPGESGRGLNFFFSDELGFGVRGWLWDRRFAAEFRTRKGYDVVPELPVLFVDAGARTTKIRLDYSDVMVALEEEGYFHPIYDWNNSRGMLYGCDHGGRGRDVTEFGDYFRTQRWMVAPGCDQPNLASDVIKNKVASSIAHLYERPRTWLEGYYGSGWGTSSADVVDATWRNFAMGQNLLTLHGLYYSTHGGWWEWAPPCNHYHMPYWAHMGEFLRASERLSYLLSQGRHRADVAILYPVAAVEAGLSGKEAVSAAFALGTHLYGKGIDFDFLDFESLARARVDSGHLQVAGESYRVLVIPSMRAVRHSTLEKARDFARSGGIVVALGALPEASERTGANDPEVRAMVRELFDSAGNGRRLNTRAEVESLINTSFPRDFACDAAPGMRPYVQHRRIGPRDVYMVYGVPKGTACSFRAGGRVELWNPWTGGTEGLAVESQSGEATRLHLPLSETEAQLIVFSPGRATIAHAASTGEATRIALDGEWEFELTPTLDNRFGDYRLPATNSFIGAEARRLRYVQSSPEASFEAVALDDSKWSMQTFSYGQRFQKLCPFPNQSGMEAFETELAGRARVDSAAPVDFSWRWGVENDPGHQGYHGLKAEMPRDLFALGVPKTKSTEFVYEAEPGGSRYYLWTTVPAPRAMEARIASGGILPTAVWINGKPAPPSAPTARLQAGTNRLLLRYDRPGRGHFVLLDPAAPQEWQQTEPLSGPWYHRPGLLPFDPRPDDAHPTGWYRFTSPPGLKSMTIVAQGAVRAWVNGVPLSLSSARPRPGGAIEYRATIEHPSAAPVKVALRIEQRRGSYGGAALEEPIQLECGKGLLAAGDWSGIDGLASYSGGAWYCRTVTLSEAAARGRVVIDLGKVVSSAEIRVNGRTAGIRLAPPYTVDLSGLVRAGDNRIEILVLNTLANHYQTIPTRYRGSPRSGLIGPVRLEWSESDTAMNPE